MARSRIRRSPVRETNIRQTAIPRTGLAKFQTPREGFEWSPAEPINHFHIPVDTVRALERDGISLQWNLRAVHGQPADDHMSAAAKAGWQPVLKGDIGPIDALYPDVPEGKPIEIKGQALEARPLAISQQARAYERRLAHEPIAMKEAEARGGLPGVAGGDHPSARGFNHIRGEREPTFVAIPIPRDERG